MSVDASPAAETRRNLPGALPATSRPMPAGPVSVSITLGWRAVLKIKHVPFQLFDVTVFPLMMTLMFTFLLGGALAGSPREYVQYLLPGIMVQAIVFLTVYTGIGLNTDIDKGLFDWFRTLPIWQPAPIVGALLGDVMRYSIAALLVVALGVMLGFRPGAGPVGVLLALALVLIFAFAVSWIWIVAGMLVRTPESVMTSSFILLFPLTMVSTIFVDPATMPGWLRAIVRVNPVTHLATASRALMHGQDVGWPAYCGCWPRRPRPSRCSRPSRCACIGGIGKGSEPCGPASFTISNEAPTLALRASVLALGAGAASGFPRARE